MNKPTIVKDVSVFLKESGITPLALAKEAGITSVILYRVLSGERRDMFSANADALRKAMGRLRPDLWPPAKAVDDEDSLPA